LKIYSHTITFRFLCHPIAILHNISSDSKLESNGAHENPVIPILLDIVHLVSTDSTVYYWVQIESKPTCKQSAYFTYNLCSSDKWENKDHADSANGNLTQRSNVVNASQLLQQYAM